MAVAENLDDVVDVLISEDLPDLFTVHGVCESYRACDLKHARRLASEAIRSLPAGEERARRRAQMNRSFDFLMEQPEQHVARYHTAEG